MGATSGAQVVAIAYRALAADEREEAFRLIALARAEQLAAGEGELARIVRSLRRAAEHCSSGAELTVNEYRRALREAVADSDGEALVPLSRVLKRFDGSWRQAREACLDLAEVETPRNLEWRLRRRKVGKMWRWPADTLADVLRDACRAHGDGSDPRGVPVRVAEFEHWRWERLAVAEAEGDEHMHLPSRAAYRRPYTTWEQALVECCGFTPDEVRNRLGGSASRASEPR